MALNQSLLESNWNDEGWVEVKQPSTKNPESSIRDLLTKGTSFSQADINSFSEIGQIAMADFGKNLLQGMSVSWERTTSVSKKRKYRQWHPAIQRWDYQEEDDTNIPLRDVRVRDILRLLRQQHIAWAAVGHSAATSEASAAPLLLHDGRCPPAQSPMDIRGEGAKVCWREQNP